MPSEELYELCKNIKDYDTYIKLFKFMERYNYINRNDEFNDNIIDMYKMACSDNNINVINNIIKCVYDGIIDLDIYWLCINNTKCAFYYMIKKYINRQYKIYSAFMDGIMCPCYYSSDPCNFIMSKTIISYGYYEEAHSDSMRKIINRIIL
jgi:hypothetical protein